VERCGADEAVAATLVRKYVKRTETMPRKMCQIDAKTPQNGLFVSIIPIEIGGILQKDLINCLQL
jgi:hypothetical protein